MKLRVAAAQIPVTNDIASNFTAINKAMDFAINEKADILLTPEGSLSGYNNTFNQSDVSEALIEILSKAKKNRLGLALGTCFYENDRLCYNQIRFYNKQGDFLGFHSKTLTCGTLTAPPKGEIEYFAVKPLQVFNFEGIAIGGLICNDMWANPECTPCPDVHLSQQLSEMGARVIFHAVNGGRDDSEFSKIIIRNFHESNLLMRARTGKIHILTVDNSFPEELHCSCQGGLISPIGVWIRKLPYRGDSYLVSDIDLD